MRLACRSTFCTCASLILAVVGSSVAHAHPGHAHEVVPAASPWHYWLQPEHALVNGTLVAIVAAIAIVVYLRWQAARRLQHMSPLPVARRRQ